MDGVSSCMACISNFPIFRGSALGDRDCRGDPPSVAYSDSLSSASNSGLGPSGGKSRGSRDELASGISGRFLGCKLYRGLILLKTLPLVSGSIEMVVLGFSSGLVVFCRFPPVFFGPGEFLGGTCGGVPGGGGAGCDGLWSSSLSDVEGMTSPSSVSVSDSSVVFLRFLTEIDRLFSSANGFL